MRCNNCGYVNDDTVSQCIKCNAPLGGAQHPGRGYNAHGADNMAPAQGTVVEKNSHAADSNSGQPLGTNRHFGGSEGPLKGTVMEPAAFGINDALGADQPMGRKRPQPVPGNDTPLQPLAADEATPQRPSPALGGTINPWTKKSSGKCYLRPADGGQATEVCSGDGSFELTRQNTNPADGSISSHQAVLTHTNNGWCIEDRSTFHTTLVLAQRPIPLHDGDIVVMGQTQFIFIEQKPE